MSSLTWNKMRKGIPSSVSSWKTHGESGPLCQHPSDQPHHQTCASNIRRRSPAPPPNAFYCCTNLSILKGDLPDQRDTFVLGPRVGQVEVGEGADVHHVRDTLPDRLVDHIVSAEALGLRRSTRGGRLTNRLKNEAEPDVSHCRRVVLE